MEQSPKAIDLLRVRAWDQFTWLRHGFSAREGGVSSVYGGASLNLGWTREDDPASVLENRGRFVQAVSEPQQNNPAFALVGLRQIHSSVLHDVRQTDGALKRKLATSDGRPALEGDGLITDVPGVLIAVGIADCVPVLVADVRKRVVAAFHAGWRGTASRIVEAGIARLRQSYGSRAEDLVAAIGPSIGPCCYTVGEDVQAEFVLKFNYGRLLFRADSDGAPRSPEPLNGSPPEPHQVSPYEGAKLDLWEANRQQLLVAGLLDSRITLLGACTACSRDGRGQLRYFSHREERGVTGRMLAAIGIAGGSTSA